MITENEKEDIRYLLMRIFKKEIPTLYGNEDSSDIVVFDGDIVYDLAGIIPKDHQYDCGCTKMVIIPEFKDYVIKLPFNGQFCFDSYEDEEQPVITDEFEDHIQKEIDIYNNSPEIVQKILSPNIFLFKFGGVPVYIQKKIVKTFGEKFYGIAARERKWEEKKATLDNYTLTTLKNYRKQRPARALDNLFILDIIKYLQCDVSEIFEFDIRDMHCNNYGYDKDNNPVIFDYAGFWLDDIS